MFGSNDWNKMIKKYNSGKINAQEFTNKMKHEKLWCALPFGEDEKGNMRPWVLNKQGVDYQFYPAFLSAEHCLQFFKKIGRGPFTYFKGDLEGIISKLDNSPITPEGKPLLADLGIVIEPSFENETAIPPGIRAEVI